MRKIETSRTTELLLRELKEADNKYPSNPDPGLYVERIRLQTEFVLISPTKVKTLLKLDNVFMKHVIKLGSFFPSSPG